MRKWHTTGERPVKARRRMRMRTREGLTAYLFFSPWIIGFILFTAYPVAFALSLSINHVQILPAEGLVQSFAGLEYYIYALRTDTTFVPAVIEVVIMAVCATPIILVLSLVIALLLNRKFIGRTFFRAIFFLPVIIMSGPVVTELLTGAGSMTILPSENVLYQIIETLPSALSQPILYALDNFVSILWMSGVQIILYLAALQKINPSLYEAASIDGATSWEKFWKITLPFVRPVILLNAIYSIVELANSADNPVGIKIEQHMFEQGKQYSYSAAMSWLYFALILLLLLAAFLICNDWKSSREKRRLKAHDR